MKRTLFLLVTGCLLAMSGCSSAPVKTEKNVSEKEAAVTGKYVHSIAPNIYIELKDDGTYCHHFGKKTKCGNYVVDGKRVIFDSEKKFEMEIEGNSLISKEGATFIKQ
ncbi:MAG TPA: hypothetical protein VMJ66_01705 [Geobacteraceae bacterium]|nr:hypothetical protein [Geobacteraceae bacterium]